MDLLQILKAHAEWVNGNGGKRANLRGANLIGSDLSGTDLRGAKGIVSFGPVGEERRIGYAVNYSTHAMVQLGCFWGTQEEAQTAIRAKYGDNSTYEALMNAACAVVLEANP
jgi:hypothetical protein